MISQSIEGQAVILLGGAVWNSANSLIIPQNITLMKLPPYSPELNQKENFWQSLKSIYCRIRFSSVEHVMDSCSEAWLDFVNIKGNVKRLCTRKWADLSHLI